ncbi:acyl carrier protein [Nonomuraea thailandensis]
MLDGQVSADRPAAGAERGAVRKAALAATAAAGLLDVLRRFLLEQVGAVLGRTPESLDTSAPLQELGFDSLMAMELRTRLETGLDLRLSATVVYTFPTVEALADGLAQRLAAERPAAPDTTTAQDAEPRVPDEPSGPGLSGEPGGPDMSGEPGGPGGLAALDEQELAALLAEELDLKGGRHD